MVTGYGGKRVAGLLQGGQSAHDQKMGVALLLDLLRGPLCHCHSLSFSERAEQDGGVRQRRRKSTLACILDVAVG